MNPMSDSDFMGQMASFSSLEQISNLAAANTQMAANLSSTSAIGLIGRTVSYVDANDQIHTGARREGHHRGRHAVPHGGRSRRNRSLNHHAGRLGDGRS